MTQKGIIVVVAANDDDVINNDSVVVDVSKPSSAPDDQRDGAVISAQLDTIIGQLSTVPDERDYRITEADISGAIVSIVLRCAGIAINARLAYDFYVAAVEQPTPERFGFFVWTVACLLVPMVVTACLQVAFYLQDVAERRTSPKNLLCNVIVLPLFLRYWQSASYAIASKRAERRGDRAAQMRYYELHIHHDSDVALMRIFECFLEVAPQKILQMYIILRGQQRAIDAPMPDEISGLQLLSLGSAIVSMAWCIAAYHRAIRWSQVDKVKSTWCASLCQWLCHFLITLSRVLAVALAASVSPQWTLSACVTHALVMAVWCMLCDRSPFCARTVWHSAAFALVLGAVFVFTYVLPRARRRTCGRYAAFYALCGAENAAAVALFVWRWSAGGGRSEWSGGWLADVRVVAALAGAALVPFGLGVVVMIVYYVRFHPNVVLRRQEQQQQRQPAAPHNADVGNCIIRTN